MFEKEKESKRKRTKRWLTENKKYSVAKLLKELDLHHDTRLRYMHRNVYGPSRTEKKTPGEISGSHGGEYEDDCLLGCCAV
jgi:hypothetical protein